MLRYVGTKIVNAKMMTRLDYNDFRQWTLPKNENGADEGYLVEYLDGGTPNTPEYKGYVSWSPKEPFENAYRPASGMSFGLALEVMRKGVKIARTSWGSGGVFLFQTSGLIYKAEGKVEPWSISQIDVLADDWCVVV
jgi:hypothetical protein